MSATVLHTLMAVGLPWPVIVAQWLLGAALSLWFVYCAVCGVANFFTIPRLGREHLRKRYPTGWAVVTGASEGIGKSFALELARSGFSVVVIARRKDKLEEVIDLIHSQSAPEVRAKAIVFDFGVTANSPSCASGEAVGEASLSSGYSRLFSELDALPGGIAVLVNNVGMALPWEGESFEDYSPEALERIVRVNALSTMHMCRYVIRGMKKRGGGGAIVNLSSLTAILRVVPFFAPYAATKAFVRSLSESLTAELEPFGVDVLTVSPGFVSTALTQGNRSTRLETSFLMVDADEVAKHTLGQLGRGGKKSAVCSLTAGHRNHQLTQWLFELLPKQWLGRILYKAVLPEAQKLKKGK